MYPRRRAIARSAWFVAALLAVVILIASLPGYASIASRGTQGGRLVDAPVRLAAVLALVEAAAALTSAVLCLALAGLIFWRKSDDRMALFVSFYLLGYGIVMAGPSENLDVLLPGAAVLSANLLQPVFVTVPTLTLFLLFPNGRFVPGWVRWLILPSILSAALSIARPNYWADRSAAIGWIGLALWLTAWLPALYAQVYRYRRVSGPTERQQAKWAVSGFALWMVLLTLLSLPYTFVLRLPSETPLPWWEPVTSAGWALSVSVMPLALTVALLRHRLWEIDVVINRAVVYGSLTVVVVGIYVVAVGVLGGLLQVRGSLPVSLLGAGVVAVVFQPLRDRLQRSVNRLMYGERDDPYAVLSRLGQRLETTLAPNAVLPTLVRTVRDALKLSYVAITLKEGEGFREAAISGQPVSAPLHLPLIFQGETVGEFILGPRAPGEALGPADLRLLGDLAHQVGVAVHAVRLTSDLQQARERLVTAREEERRRLRRDLHDGLGPLLASQTLTLDAVSRLLNRDPAAAASLVQDLKAQLQVAIRDIRQLVYDLRPPALDELGLVGALREEVTQYRRSAVRFTVHSEEPLPSLPAAVEVAAYRIAQEAITNVVRHAEANHCDVRLTIQDEPPPRALHVEVLDDGRGMASDRRMGVGLHSMRERAEELGGRCSIEAVPGGGTRVHASLSMPSEDS